MYKVKVNGQYDFDIDKNGDVVLLNGKAINAEMKQLSASGWHIISDLKSYNAEVVSFNAAEKTAGIKVNNTVYTVTAKDQFDLLLDKLGMSNMAGAKVSELKAPMPGLVLKIFVAEGAEAKKGDNLFVLEAMKMENIIKAPADVTVKTVKIKPGDKVEKNQVLLQFS
jgi:acetyl/propionyl-CoA carboxylase alpha subunit